MDGWIKISVVDDVDTTKRNQPPIKYGENLDMSF